MGRTHLAALAGSRQVLVTGLAEPDPATRAATARPGLPGFATVAELVAAGNLDGVLVAAPTSAHDPIVTEIAAAGLPVLCEKPCGLDTAQAQACAAAADRAGVLLQVAYWRRFVPELAALRQRIRAGELGRVLAVNCYQWDEAPPGAGFRGASGGIFADMGVHEFDQVRWLTGQEFGALRVAAARPDAAGEAGPASERRAAALFSRRATRRDEGAPRSEEGRQRLLSGPGASEAGSTDPDCAQAVAGLDGGGTALISLVRWHPAGTPAGSRCSARRAPPAWSSCRPAPGTPRSARRCAVRPRTSPARSRPALPARARPPPTRSSRWTWPARPLPS